MSEPCVNAMVLGAGLGTRLRPLTEVVPKPLLPILGVTVLDVTMALLKRAGVFYVVMNLHHLSRKLRPAAIDCALRNGLSIEFLDEGETLLGTGGGVRNAADRFHGADAVIIVNGDTYLEADLGGLVKRHLEHGARATMLLRDNPDPRAYAPVETSAGGRIRRVAGQPPWPGDEPLEPWLFAGVHVLDPEFISLLPPDVTCDINRTLYPTLIASGELVRGETFTGPWFDLGTPRRLLAATLDCLTSEDRIATYLSHERGYRFRGRDGRSLISQDTTVADDASIDASVVRAGARIGPGARLLRSLVLEGAVVAAGTSVVDSIVGPGAITDENEVIQESVAMSDRRERFALP